VEARHDLHAREDRVDVVAVGVLGLDEVAVDAVADDQLLFARLDVDIGGALLDRLEHDRVDPADDRRLIGEIEDVDQLLRLAVHVVVAVAAEIDAALLARVDLVDRLEDRVAGDDHRFDQGLQGARDVVECVYVERGGGVPPSRALGSVRSSSMLMAWAPAVTPAACRSGPARAGPARPRASATSDRSAPRARGRASPPRRRATRWPRARPRSR